MTVIHKVKTKNRKTQKNVGLVEMKTTMCEIKLNGVRLVGD